MSRERICAYLGLAIAIAALIWDRGLDASEHRERGYLIRNASFVLTMDPSLGDRSLSDGPSLGLLKDVDVHIVGDQVAAVRRFLRPPAGVRVIERP